MAFYFQDDFWETVKELPKKQREKAIASLVEYFFTGEEPDISGVESMPFKAFRGRIDIARKQSANASRPRKPRSSETSSDQDPEASQTVAKPEPEDSQIGEASAQSKRESKSKNKEREKRKEKFSPPSPEDVSRYSAEKGHPIDGESFCDFYHSKGWKVGNTPMKDWRAAVRTWINREKAEGKGGGASANVEQYIGSVAF